MKYLSILITAVIILSSQIEVYSSDAAADELIKRFVDIAIESFNDGKYDTAKKQFEALKAVNPSLKQTTEYLERINFIIRQSIREKDRKISSLEEKAEAYLYKSEYESAKKCFLEMMKIDPENSYSKEGYKIAEMMLNEINDKKQKKANYSKIEKMTASAVKFYEAGNRAKAKEYFDKIVEIDPENKKAKEYLLKYENTLINTANIHVNELYSQGIDYYIKGKYNEAIKSFDAATLAALKYFEAIVFVPPQRLDSYDFIEECRRKIREEEEKIENMQMEKVKERVMVSIERTEKFIDKGYYKVAINEVEKTLDFVGLLEIADLKVRLKQLLEESKIRLSEQSLTQGLKKFEVKEFEKAYNLFLESVKYNPNNSQAREYVSKTADIVAQGYYEAGMAFFSKGSIAEAKESFEKAILVNPYMKEAVRALERVAK